MSSRPDRRRGRIVAASLLAVSLCGCVSLLPKQTPVQLYQFGQAAPPPPAAAGAPVVVGRGQPVLGVILAQVGFPRAATGDGLLTSRGQQAAYIASARWLTPAVLMFQEDAERAFAEHSTDVRLIGAR